MSEHFVSHDSVKTAVDIFGIVVLERKRAARDGMEGGNQTCPLNVKASAERAWPCASSSS